MQCTLAIRINQPTLIVNVRFICEVDGRAGVTAGVADALDPVIFFFDF